MKSGARFFYRNKTFESINNSLIIKYDSTKVKQLWQAAGQKYDQLFEKYKTAPSAQKYHLKKIIPITALYLTLREDSPDDCMEIISDQVKSFSLQERKKVLECSNKHPFLFLKLYKLNLLFNFRQASAFSLHFYPCPKNQLRFVEEKSLYRDFCNNEECPELSEVFYKQIELKYSGLPKIDFGKKYVSDEDLPEGAWEFFMAVKDKSLWPEEEKI